MIVNVNLLIVFYDKSLLSTNYAAIIRLSKKKSQAVTFYKIVQDKLDRV